MTEPIKSEYLVQFDEERGTVSVIDEFMRSEIQVRKGIEEKATRAAVIVELERLGYTITAPGRPLTNDEYELLDLIRGLVMVYNHWSVAHVNELDIDALLEMARDIAENGS